MASKTTKQLPPHGQPEEESSGSSRGSGAGRQTAQPTSDREPGPREEPTGAFRRRILVGAMIVVALIVVLYFLWQAVYVLLLVFAGILFAVLLRSLAVSLTRYARLPVGWSLAVVVTALAGLLALVVWVAAVPISQQFEQLSEQLPASIESLRQRISQYQWGRWVLDAAPTTQSLRENGGSLWRTRGLLTNAFNFMVAALVISFVGLYLAAEPELYTNGLLRLVPRKFREDGARILASVEYTLRWWIIGQGVTMVIIGVLTAIGLWAIGVPLWFLLGLLAALFNFVPNFGPLVSFIPAVLLALAISPTKAIWVAGLYVVAQSLEGYVITPLVQRRAVLMPPALTLTAQVLLGVLVGLLGVMIAAPLTAAVLVIIKMLYVEETLGDEVETPDDHLKRSDIPPVPK